MQHSNGLLNGKPSGKRSFRTHSRLCAIERGLPKLLLTAQSPIPVISIDLKRNNLIGMALNVSRSRWTLAPPRWAYHKGVFLRGIQARDQMSRGTQLNLQASLFIHTCWWCVVSSWSLRLNHNVWTTLEYKPARMIHETNTKLCHIKLKAFTNSSDHT